MAITAPQKNELIQRAQQARAAAYAPYSGYSVGAAVLTSKGNLYSGVNVENASYPLSMCAERVAVFQAVTAGDRDIEAVAVVTENGGSPCGGCRQVLSEFGLDAELYMVDGAGEIVVDTTVRALLPHAFGPGDLPGAATSSS